MEATVSKRTLEKANMRTAKALERIKHIKMEAQKVTKTGIRSVTVAVAAGAVGYFEAKATKIEDTEVLGLPAGLALAAIGTVINVAGYGGDEQTSDLIQGAADGGLAAYAYKKGMEMGAEAKAA